MTKTGKPIERNPEQLPDHPAGEAVPVEVVPVTAGGILEAARDARAQRAEVANRVLSLLGSLGHLA
ncbi:MAG: hypothetical protein MUQ30_12745, partial [Anaerolineae bacterium]|nr:hypothetical protein [Anaerolineae bacterium]